MANLHEIGRMEREVCRSCLAGRHPTVARIAFVVVVALGLASCAAPPPSPPEPGIVEPGIVDFTTYKERHQWPTTASPRDLAIDPSGHYALVSFVSGPGSELTYLDLGSGASHQLDLEQPAPSSLTAWAIAIHPRGDRFAAGWEGRSAIYHRDAHTMVRELDHSHGQSRVNYSDLAFSPDGQSLVGALRDVVWWNAESGEKLHVIQDIEGPQRVSISRDGILGVTTYQRVILRDPGSGKNVCEFDGGAAAIAFSEDGRQVAFATTEDPVVRVLRVPGCEEIAQLSFGATFIPVIAWMPDNTHLATGSDDGRVRIWDVSAGELVHSLEAHDGGLAGMVVSGDGQVMITGSWGSDVIKSWVAERL